MANYAVGDIQGCYKEFDKGLKKINFNEKKDRLWISGDIVNRLSLIHISEPTRPC